MDLTLCEKVSSRESMGNSGEKAELSKTVKAKVYNLETEIEWQ